MKSPILRTLYISIFSSVLMISCTSDDGPDFDTNTNFLDYLVFYDSDLNSTIITAEFKKTDVFGSNITLEKNESITFRGEELTYDESKVLYSKEYAGLITSGDIVYTSSEGKVYTSSLVEYQSVDFSQAISSFSKSNGLVISWTGEPLVEREFIEFLIGVPEQNNFAGLVLEEEGTADLVLKSEDMAGLTSGTWPAYLQRGQLTYPPDLTSVGGRIVTKYRSKTIEIEVTE
ncbi:MAG: hypothetical protein ABJG47_09790 [Ekhidna sp.]